MIFNKLKLVNFKSHENTTIKFENGISVIVGENGAGKSTLLNIITDNLREDEGHVLYDGEDIHKNSKK